MTFPICQYPNMNRLHILIGLPRAGKSTKSKELGFPIVETDSIRKAIGSYPFIPEREPEVWYIAKTMVNTLFETGYTDVILDATSHTKKSREEWISNKYQCVYHVIDTPLETCLDRAVLTNQEYLIPVIKKMSKELEFPSD